MIHDLKKNIETEFDILREIANLTNQVEISSENERRLLFRAIDSLRRSLKIVNNSIPNLIESLDETGREGKRETIVELERVEFKGEHTKISITVPVFPIEVPNESMPCIRLDGRLKKYFGS